MSTQKTPAALAPDFEATYDQLRSVASNYVRRYSHAPTLQATALVHEVYLKFARATGDFANRTHFVCTAATAMRQILVDHVKAKRRTKRGGQFQQVILDDIAATSGCAVDLLALDEALDRLAAWDARQARIVELRFFIGLSVEEVAELLNISEKTVKRDWAMARAWLQHELASTK